MSLILKTVGDVINALNALGAKYRIVMSDGATYDTLPKQPPADPQIPLPFDDVPKQPPNGAAEKVSKEPKYRKDLHHYYVPLLKDVPPGSLVEVPYNGLNEKRLSNAIMAWASVHWGRQSYTCCRAKKGVQILRVK